MYAAVSADLLPQGIAAAVPEAPWNMLEPEDNLDAAEPSRLGLGCSALPEYEYQEEATPAAEAQPSARPLYDRYACPSLFSRFRSSSRAAAAAHSVLSKCWWVASDDVVRSI